MKKNSFFKSVFVVAISLTPAFLLQSCTTTNPNSSDITADVATPLYTSYNVWFEHPDKIWSTNYKIGNFIPAGTMITNAESARYRRHRILSFTVPSMGDMRFVIHFVSNHHPGLTFDEFKDRLLTTDTFDQITAGFTTDEIEAIKSTSPHICKGMTKKAAIVSWGYPPETKTPSLDQKRWIYWINRFKTVAVDFDNNGKAVKDINTGK